MVGSEACEVSTATAAFVWPDAVVVSESVLVTGAVCVVVVEVIR